MKLQNSGLMILRQLDKKLQKFSDIQLVEVPQKGWINAVRSVLNMSLKQLGTRLGMTAQGIRDLEQREQEETITLKALRQAGESLNLKLVYGFIPLDGSLENMLDKQAEEIASKIITRTKITMKLEDQENSDERLKQALEEMKEQIKREVGKSLWD